MAQNPFQTPQAEQTSQQETTKKDDIPTSAHVMCGWPLVLVLIGGLVGGACGGAAYAINLAIYKSNMANGIKIVLNLLTGLAAIGLWLGIVSALAGYLAG